MYEYVTRSVADLIPYANNSRTHSDKQVIQIASSIKEFGFTNPVLIDENDGVIAGHGRLMAANKLKLDEVPCIVLEGLTEAQKKAYVIADNRIALSSDWDEELLKIELEALKSLDFDLDLLGFELGELTDILGLEEDDNPYTQTVEVPTYVPSDEKPKLEDCFDDSRAFDLIEKIKSSTLPQAEKDFLMLAAGRHVKLDFELIADYYAHSDADMQALMEDNALVIIDFKKAIENGYLELEEKISAQYLEDYPDEAQD